MEPESGVAARWPEKRQGKRKRSGKAKRTVTYEITKQMDSTASITCMCTYV
jgi:hypothetical protein